MKRDHWTITSFLFFILSLSFCLFDDIHIRCPFFICYWKWDVKHSVPPDLVSPPLIFPFHPGFTCDCLTLSGFLITVMCLRVCVSFTHSPDARECACIPTRVHTYTITAFALFYRVCFHVRLGRSCLINFKRQHCVFARAGVCLFMGLCASAVFVGPKCVLNLDRETSMCTVISFLLHVIMQMVGVLNCELSQRFY